MLRQTIDRNRRILLPTARGVASGILRRRAELRHHVVRDAWTLAKRFAADAVQNIELREISCLGHAVVEGYVDDPQRLILAALARGLDCRTFFEIGTNRGRTTWTVARNNPDLVLYTLDVAPAEASAATAYDLGADDRAFFRPDSACGEAFRGTPETGRITQLWGDSATFDFSPYAGAIDFVYVDGAHTYEYVRVILPALCASSAPGARSCGTTTRAGRGSMSTSTSWHLRSIGRYSTCLEPGWRSTAVRTS